MSPLLKAVALGTPEALPYPILRRLSRPRYTTLHLAAGRSGGAAAARWVRRKRRGPGVAAGGGRWGGRGRGRRQMPFMLPCDPLVERKLRLPSRPRGKVNLVTQCIMRVQVPPPRCRSDSISPRPATGPQRSEAGRNGRPWQPQSGDPVSQASMGSASAGVVEPP
jgi:hypothetical protein